MLEITKIPKEIRKQIRKVARETPAIHLGTSLLYAALFVASIVTETYQKARYEAHMTNQRYDWTSGSENTYTNYVDTSISIAMILWVGSLVMAVWHFLHWFLWGKSFGSMDSLKTKFARHFEIASRWWAFVIVEVFIYVTITALFINFDSYMIASRVLIAVAISALFFSFDRVNRPYLIESLSDSPVELKGFIESDTSKQADQVEKGISEEDVEEAAEEVIQRAFKLDLYTFGVASALSVTMWFFFIYRLYDSGDFTDAPTFLKCLVWFFMLFNGLTILSSMLAYLKPSAISHIRSSSVFYLLNFLTFASVAITALVGLYANY